MSGSPQHQQPSLADLGSLGADAASCCVQAGMVGRAVELFEQGRGVLLGQALDTRTDLTALTEQHPDLAASFVRLRDVLDQADDSAVLDLPRSGEGTAGAAGVDRQAAGVAFEELIASIRRRDGFETFLRPPPVDDLLATAAQGPVVAVAVSRFGSYALLLTPGGVETVALPELTPQTVYDQVVAFLDALDDTSTAAQGRLVEVLGWLWDVLAGPVLDRAGLTGPPAGGQRWPRLWWCTSGLLSFLPLHAAGHHDSRHDPAPATVIDRAVSSYTPTVRALAHARPSSPAAPGGAASLEGARMAVVAMPHTPAALDLPGAGAEAAALEQRFGSRVEVLTGPRATREAVLSVLPAARWAHFACHGTAEITNPSISRLLLHDHQTRPLTVLDVARLRLTDAQLAYLSACETARPGGSLTDEAIHLASAFQLAGYQHVIATLWPIADRPAVGIADGIYTALAATGDVADAVHTTTRRWRRRLPGTPSVWASHIHVGA
ncbi:CHAT domain-containing protein [Frankia tisae]|uniref:CHAT domain-containing protein n=1 Tax=Frankia tisae TaxID=2950104 RepID=UPI0027E345B6|nr:CHAT domain-containing protein [Frankia tisae]